MRLQVLPVRRQPDHGADCGAQGQGQEGLGGGLELVLPPLLRPQAQVSGGGHAGQGCCPAKKETKHEENYRRCTWEDCDWDGCGGDAGLKTHVDAKHKGVTFKCEDCGKAGFGTKGALTRHIKNACPFHLTTTGPSRTPTQWP